MGFKLSAFWSKSKIFAEPNYCFLSNGLGWLFSCWKYKKFSLGKKDKKFGWVKNLDDPGFCGLGCSIYNYLLLILTKLGSIMIKHVGKLILISA